MGLTAFLFAYVLGGLTFLPLALAAVLLHAHLTFPYRRDLGPEAPAKKGSSSGESDIVQPGDDVSPLHDARTEAGKEDDAGNGTKSRAAAAAADVDTSAGYFAVCREYTPMGINAKPIERSTPVGSATVAAPSQSVYQTMYRSIFDRKQTPGLLDSSNNLSQRPKNAGNVFYVVLRHGHLMLFDDDEQLEVRHVISLAHHNVSIYSGGDVTPEGELYIKRNAICLARRVAGSDEKVDAPISKPFYLFSENCSAKEDFYFALLRNQEQALGNDVKAPAPLQFDVKNIISLVERLHSKEDHAHTRWLNAMIGRIFLSIYKTKDLENFIREKLTKKISRVKRPTFLSHIAIRDIKTGDSAPYISNPRLKELTVDGECVVEADVRYTGGFRMEVTAVARIDLGSRFKVREVDLVLAVVIKKVEGHCFFKIKAPPSNRVWLSFQTMPKLEMTIEPIVSSRQITYTLILRQIENRFKEVFAETLVLPFWDDTPFFRTEHKQYRGGIWEGDDTIVPSPDAEKIAAQIGDVDLVGQYEEKGEAAGEGRFEKSHSVPNIATTSPTTSIFGRMTASKGDPIPKSSSTSVDASGLNMGSSGSASPVISIDVGAEASPLAEDAPQPLNDAASGTASTALTAESSVQEAEAPTSATTPTQASSTRAKADSIASNSSAGTTGSKGRRGGEHASLADVSRQDTLSSKASTDSTTPSKEAVKSMLKSHTGSISRGFFRRANSGSTEASVSSTSTDGNPNSKRNTLQAVTNAAAQARQWGWSAIQRQKEGRNSPRADNDNGGNGNNSNHLGGGGGGTSHSSVDLSQPMGRGRPLPPPGMPLPPPEKKSTPVHFPKRKSLPPPPPPPLLPERSSHVSQSSEESMASKAVADGGGGSEKHGKGEEKKKRKVPPPPLPKRRLREGSQSGDNAHENVFVVAAPSDSEQSEPASPMLKPRAQPESANHHYLQPSVEDAPDSGHGDEPDHAATESMMDTSYLPTPRPSVSQTEGGLHEADGGARMPSPGEEEPADPITAVPVEVEEDESDDGYSGWMDDSALDVEVPHTPPQATKVEAK